MTEFGKTPFMTAQQFEALGYKLVIWPVSALRMAAKAHEELYACLRDEGWAKPVADRMQTRAELYATIGYHAYEELDGTIAQSVVPGANLRGEP
jgi:methylisocitrate lyase